MEYMGTNGPCSQCNKNRYNWGADKHALMTGDGDHHHILERSDWGSNGEADGRTDSCFGF